MKKLINLAKALDFTTEQEYFDYMIESHINGNFEECRELYNDMKPKDRVGFIQYISSSDFVDNKYNSMFKFYTEYSRKR